METDASGAVEASYVLAGPELISQRRAGSTSYYLHDAQGSVRGLADTAGEITDQYTYAAFGELVEQEGATDNPYLHTGQQYDEASGLYSLRARYYDPTVGRFLSRDPLEQWRNVRELNRYSYAASDPVNLSDATGLQALSEGGWLNTVVGLSTRVALKRFVGGMARGMLFAAAFYIIGVHVCGGRFAEELVKVGIWRVIAYGALFGGTLSMLGASSLRGARLLRGGIEMLIATTMGLKSISDLLGPEPNLCDLLMLFFAALLFRHGLGLVGEGLDMPPSSAGGQANDIAGQQEPCADCDGGATRPGTVDEAYHHTYSRWIESIETEGLRPGTYATPTEGLSPLQAQIELALPPNRGLPDVVFRIDLAGLRAAGYEIPPITRVTNVVLGTGGRVYSVPGGGYSIYFEYSIPPEFIEVIR